MTFLIGSESGSGSTAHCSYTPLRPTAGNGVHGMGGGGDGARGGAELLVPVIGSKRGESRGQVGGSGHSEAPILCACGCEL